MSRVVRSGRISGGGRISRGPALPVRRLPVRPAGEKELKHRYVRKPRCHVQRSAAVGLRGRHGKALDLHQLPHAREISLPRGLAQQAGLTHRALQQLQSLLVRHARVASTCIARAGHAQSELGVRGQHLVLATADRIESVAKAGKDWRGAVAAAVTAR